MRAGQPPQVNSIIAEDSVLHRLQRLAEDREFLARVPGTLQRAAGAVERALMVETIPRDAVN